MIERAEGRRRWNASITQNDFIYFDWNQLICSAFTLESVGIKLWELNRVLLDISLLDLSSDAKNDYR